MASFAPPWTPPTSTRSSTRSSTRNSSTKPPDPSPSSLTRKNAGPLTTAFEAPSRCFDRTLDTAVFDTLDQGGYEYAQDMSIFVTDANSVRAICPSASASPCLPRADGRDGLLGRNIFFSPGLECPSSWRTVASATAPSKAGGFIFINGIIVSTLLPDESAHVCCPIGFDYVVNVPPSPPIVYCSSAIEKFDSRHKQWTCSGNSTFRQMTATDPGYVITLTTTVSGRPSRLPVSFMTVKVYAPTIQLNRRPRDVTAATTAATAATSAAGGASVSGPGLHGGAVAGVAVAVAGLMALVGVVVGVLLKRRRRRREAGATLGGGAKPELDGTARPDGRHGRSELEGREFHELDDNEVFELHDGHASDQDVADNHEQQKKRRSGLRFSWQ